MNKSIKAALFERLHLFDLKQFKKKLDLINGHIRPGMKILDVGCGDGRFAKYLSEKCNCVITGLDTIDYLSVDLPFVKYDGNRIPFADSTFDISICSAVIHHTPDPYHALKEISRVSSKVILIEDYCATTLGKVGLHLNDYFTNIIQNIYKYWCGYHKGSVFKMQWRLNFLTESELRTFFTNNNMKLESFVRTQKSWKGMSHGIYVISQ